MYIDRTEDLIKTAAIELLRKKADLGYTNGYLSELSDRLGGTPKAIYDTGAYLWKHKVPVVLGTAALGTGIYAYNKYRHKKNKEDRIKRQNKSIIIPEEVKVTTEAPVETIPSDVIKQSSYRINKVVNWLYN